MRRSSPRRYRVSVVSSVRQTMRSDMRAGILIPKSNELLTQSNVSRVA